jgi:hypothetical protein
MMYLLIALADFFAILAGMFGVLFGSSAGGGGGSTPLL